MILVYDGTFESFLSLVYDLYYEKLQPTKILKERPKTLLDDDILEIVHDELKSEKVLKALKEQFEKEHFETILNTFMCDSVEFELDLLNFIILGFKSQCELSNINHTFIFNIQNLQKELFRNFHKMSGFVRFCELEDGVLYAKIETKFNLLYFLAKHFLKRFNNQNFIIHDVNRKMAFIKNESRIGFENIAFFDEPEFSKNEHKFSTLWRTFFSSVAIKERKNIKLQKSLVPLIYRTYMNEFQI